MSIDEANRGHTRPTPFPSKHSLYALTSHCTYSVTRNRCGEGKNDLDDDSTQGESGGISEAATRPHSITHTRCECVELSLAVVLTIFKRVFRPVPVCFSDLAAGGAKSNR